MINFLKQFSILMLMIFGIIGAYFAAKAVGLDEPPIYSHGE